MSYGKFVAGGAALVAVAALVGAGTSLGAGTAGTASISPGQIEADVFVTVGGDRHVVAQLEGSLNRSGKGELQFYPVEGAGPRYLRGELSKVSVRTAKGGPEIVVAGGRGTRLVLKVSGTTVTGSGRLALDSRSIGKKVHVTLDTPVQVRGIKIASRYQPRQGDALLVVGHPTGDVYDALAKLYKVRRYNPAAHARNAYLAHPASFARVGGVIVGPDAKLNQALIQGIIQPFYLSGRWVAASPRTKAFDEAIYKVHHFTKGSRTSGLVVRLRTGAAGNAARNRVHIQEPIIALLPTSTPAKLKRRVSVMLLPAAKPSQLPAGVLAQLRAKRLASLTSSLRAGALDGVSVKSRRTQVAGDAPTNTATTDNSAFYEVDVAQTIDVIVQWWTLGQYAVSCPPYGDCNAPSSLLSQDVNVQYDSNYLVMLSTAGGFGTPRQEVAEVSNITVSAVGFSSGSNPVAGTINNDQSVTAGSNKEIAWLVGGVYHRIHMGCTASTTSTTPCNQIDSTNPAVPQFQADNSQPQNQITSASSGSSSSSGTSSSTSVTSSWTVGGNFGFFGGDPTGGVSGSYGQSTSTTVSSSYSLSKSIDYTVQNWILTPKMGRGPDASFLMYSQGIANAPGIDFGGSGSSSGWIADPIDGDLGPGPSRTPTTVPTNGHLGYGMNVTRLIVPSVSSFVLNPLAIGTVMPSTTDNIFLEDIFNDPDVPGTQWGQIQIRNQQDVVGAIDPDNTNWNTGSLGTGSTTSSGIQQATAAVYFNSAGKLLGSGAAYATGSAYSFAGLDLCAPPVDYLTLWNGGCYTQYPGGAPITK